MNKGMSFICIILGAFLLKLTHSGILEGRLYVGRGGSTTLALADSNFWFAAGMQYGFGFMMISLGVLYVTTGYRYLPKIDRNDRVMYLKFSAIIVFIMVIIAFVLKYILQSLYI